MALSQIVWEIPRPPPLTGGKLRQKEMLMDAREYFNYVAMPKYNEFVQSPNDFRLLESALYSMDTVAERLGLHQLGYAQVSREALYQKAKEIRDQSTSLENLHSCSNALKHGRSIRDHSDNFMTIATSTGIDPNDPTTWKIGMHNLVQVAHDGFATLNSFPELKPLP
jgi:hypothetical protein